MSLWKSVVLGLVLTLAATAGTEAQTWRVYSSPDGRFSIDMPGTPKIETIPVTNNDGSKTTLVQASIELPEAYYMVSYLDYGPNLDTQKTLMNLRDRYAAMGTMHRKKPPYPGQPGLEVAIERPDGIFVNARNLIVVSRLYQMVVTSHNADYRPDTQRFFNSFRPLSP
jgi:hypothetical protein